MDNLLQDLRYSIRVLLKSRGFTIVAVIALALGIGANTAVFSVVNAVLLRPLAFKEPDRLVMMFGASLTTGRGRASISPPDFVDFRQEQQVFDRLSASMGWSASLTGAGEPERITSARVTEGFFETLGIEPLHGRTFLREEEQSGRDQVVILGYGLWQRRFGSDPAIVGQNIMLNDGSYTVVGVMPQGFQFPRQVELWLPITFGTPQTSVRRFHYLRPIARLKPGVTLQQAQSEFTAITTRLAEQYPDSNRDFGARLVLLTEETVGEMRPSLLILLAAVAFVLLIACANVANLLLARAAVRQKEISIRAALGASRSRVIRQLLTESIVLSLVGGALGFLIAVWGVKALTALTPANIPRVQEVTIDGRVLAFTLFVSVATGILFGLLPAWQASRVDLNESLKEGGRSAAGGARHRVRGLLVVSEVALALVLLVAAGLLIRSFLRLSQVDPGFQPSNVLTFQIALTQKNYPKEQQRVAFYQQLIHRLESLPGAQAVGTITQLPMSGQQEDTRFTVEGRAADPQNPDYANQRVASPDYFRALGIPLLRGRYFTEQDSMDAPHAVIISESFANEVFPGEDPIGKHIGIDIGENWKAEIVGVVGNIRHNGLGAAPWREMYVNHYQAPIFQTNLVVRSAVDPTQLTAAVKGEVRALDPNVPVFGVTTMEKLVSESVAQPRFRTLLLAIFAAVAMILAAVGIYGVMSYYVSQRTHEIGIRMALGAERKDVMRLVMKQGLTLTLAGVGLGLGAAFALTRILASLLFGVSASDPLTFAAIPLLLTGVALGACFVPARRAMKVDPMVALRYE